MSVEFKLPQLAEGIDNADVAELHVKAGDTIEAGQIVMELETDKAVMELPSPHAGKITQLLVKKGDTVKVGQPILQIDAVGAESNGESAKAAPAKEAAPAQAGGKSEKDVVAAAADASAAAEKPAASTATKDAPSPSNGSSNGTPVPAGPATRRMARELGVDLHRLTGSGPGGRITSEDVARAFAGSSGGSTGVVVPSLPDFAQFGPIERQGYTRLQKTVATNLSLAWQVIPHVTQHDLADITDIEAARKRFVENAGKNAPKVTMTAITMKAVVACLQQFPNFNSSFDATKGELILKRYYHIGVAVDTPTGLVVPVIRDVDQKSVVQLAAELTQMAEKARNGKLGLDEMRGGTFTITNLGGIGGTAFTPIVNYPEVAILGMSRTQKQLVLTEEGKVRERQMLPFSLSYDHRVINGADAARFLVRLAGMFTDPFQLLVQC